LPASFFEMLNSYDTEYSSNYCVKKKKAA